MSEFFFLGSALIDLDASETEWEAFSKMPWNAESASIPVKSVLLQLVEMAKAACNGKIDQTFTIYLNFPGENAELMIDFPCDSSNTGIGGYPIELPWVRNETTENATIAAISRILKVGYQYVRSQKKENSFYIWKI